jgi:hypothetical protein
MSRADTGARFIFYQWQATCRKIPAKSKPEKLGDSFTNPDGATIVENPRQSIVGSRAEIEPVMKKWIIRIVVVVLVLLVAAVGGSIYFLGAIVKKGVETVGPQITKTELRLNSATLSLLSGSGKLKGLFVGNPQGFKAESAIKVGAVSLGVVPLSVFSDKVHVTQVNVEMPEITFEGGLKGNNLSKLLDNVQASTGGAGASASNDKASSRKIQVDDLLITGGKINLSVDAGPLGSKSATVPLPEIHLTRLGGGPDGITAGDLTAKVLKEILQAAIPAAEKAVVDLGKSATGVLKDVGKDPAGTVDKAAKSVTDIFKKKK